MPRGAAADEQGAQEKLAPVPPAPRPLPVGASGVGSGSSRLERQPRRLPDPSYVAASLRTCALAFSLARTLAEIWGLGEVRASGSWFPSL